MSRDYHGAFVRWQGRAIDQLSFVNNLFIGLSSGLLALQMRYTPTATSTATAPPTVTIVGLLSLLSGACFFLSLGVGCWLALNRLDSFRKTAALARQRDLRHRDPNEEVPDALPSKLMPKEQ